MSGHKDQTNTHLELTLFGGGPNIPSNGAEQPRPSSHEAEGHGNQGASVTVKSIPQPKYTQGIFWLNKYVPLVYYKS